MSDLRPRIAIRYCTQCRWLLRAAWLAQELLSTFGTDLGEVALAPGTGGVFEITCNGETIGSARPMAAFPTPRRSNVACATALIQVAISATSTAPARTKTGSEIMVKGDAPGLLLGPETRRALQLDALAAILPMDRRDRLAELLTDDDVETLKHLAREGMGENSLRALAPPPASRCRGRRPRRSR